MAADCGNRVGGVFTSKLFRSLGCELQGLCCEVDGHFPNHHPDLIHLENLQSLIKNLQTTASKLGFAFDGDANSFGVVTKDGLVIFPNREKMLFAIDVFSRNSGGQIIYDVKYIPNLASWVKQRGSKPLVRKMGHSLVKVKLKATDAPSGNVRTYLPQRPLV
nr:hypothetical protein [Polynucleobacter sp. HIN6]